MRLALQLKRELLPSKGSNSPKKGVTRGYVNNYESNYGSDLVVYVLRRWCIARLKCALGSGSSTRDRIVQNVALVTAMA